MLLVPLWVLTISQKMEKAKQTVLTIKTQVLVLPKLIKQKKLVSIRSRMVLSVREQ